MAIGIGFGVGWFIKEQSDNRIVNTAIRDMQQAQSSYDTNYGSDSSSGSSIQVQP